MEESDYNSIYLLPKTMSSLNSRNEVNLESDFHGLYPIFSSPMKGVSGLDLVVAMAQNNCFGILHRFATVEERIQNIHKLGELNIPFGVAIGIGCWETEFDIASCAFEQRAKMLCVDLANGYLSRLGDIGKRLRDRFGNDISLMTGNIVTVEAAQFLADSGYDFVRVGIGGGNLCSTRNITGIGRNTLVALKECSDVNINLVVDGGIKNSGDITKSIACGADFVMMGSILGMALEAENDGLLYGMASLKNHINSGKEIKSIEGIEQIIDNTQKISLKNILGQLLWGIKSSCTYLNCKSYTEIPYNCKIKYIDEKISL